MINKISQSPNFCSKVYITNYDHKNARQRNYIESPEFLEKINELENNGNNDNVVFSPEDFGYLLMNITQKDEKGTKVYTGYLDIENDDVIKKYEKFKTKLNKQNYIEDAPITKYII